MRVGHKLLNKGHRRSTWGESQVPARYRGRFALQKGYCYTFLEGKILKWVRKALTSRDITLKINVYIVKIVVFPALRGKQYHQKDQTKKNGFL